MHTVTTGSTSAGNRTFLIRLPPAISTPAASASEDWNQVQGRMPQAKNSRYGSMSGGRGTGSMYVNTMP